MTRMKIKILLLVVAVVFVGLFAFGVYDIYHKNAIRAIERIVYEGRVTAVENYNTISIVYLNSNAQKVVVQSINLQLAVGEEYVITVDGNGKLINASIIK